MSDEAGACLAPGGAYGRLGRVVTDDCVPAVCATQVRNFYIELLKRMDDSNDRIRIECATAFEKFMASVPRNYDSAQYDYIVRGLVVHLDDQNQEVSIRSSSRSHLKVLPLLPPHSSTTLNPASGLCPIGLVLPISLSVCVGKALPYVERVTTVHGGAGGRRRERAGELELTRWRGRPHHVFLRRYKRGSCPLCWRPRR